MVLFPSGSAAFPDQMPDTTRVSASCHVFLVHALNLPMNPVIGDTDVSAIWEWRDFAAPKSQDCPCLQCLSATLSLFYTCICQTVPVVYNLRDYI